MLLSITCTTLIGRIRKYVPINGCRCDSYRNRIDYRNSLLLRARGARRLLLVSGTLLVELALAERDSENAGLSFSFLFSCVRAQTVGQAPRRS